MTMAARKSIELLVALAIVGASTRAAADTQWEWRPRFSVMGGYDSNVLLNGSGGDAFGQVVPGLKLDVFGEHQLRVHFDCQVGLARLQDPQEFGFSDGRIFASENCDLGWRQKFSERDKFLLRTTATYAQDPFAIASLGLLLRPGQTRIFVGKFTTEIDHGVSGHTALNFGFDANTLIFQQGDPGNGYVLSPRLKYEFKTDAHTQWDAGVREQLFFGIQSGPNPLAPHGTPGGLLDQSHSALFGVTYNFSDYSELVMHAGPALLTGDDGNHWLPVVRAEWNNYTPTTEVRITLGHDLVIGPSGAGALVGDIAEIGVLHQWEQLGGHVRIGAYRNASVLDQWAPGSSGYGGEVGLDWSFTRNLKLGAAFARDANIYDPTIVNGLVDRNVIQVHLTYEKAHL
jgi:hypothetical protein